MGDRSAHELLEKMRRVLHLHKLPSFARKIIVGLFGGLLIGVGVVMIFTPGPALLLIPLGLLLLASEFRFAQRWADKAMQAGQGLRKKWRNRKHRAA